MALGMGGWTCCLAVVLAIVASAAPATVGAQFDPARVSPEPAGVAARFAEPATSYATSYATPAFRAGRTDFPTHAEALDFARGLAARIPGRVRVELVGESQEGRPLPLVVLSGADGVSAALPTVLILAQQHGNEPAGGEAALALTDRLAGPDAALLDRVNVLIVPRANPDGAERFARTTASGIDVNRDHLLLQTPEAQAIAAVARRRHRLRPLRPARPHPRHGRAHGHRSSGEPRATPAGPHAGRRCRGRRAGLHRRPHQSRHGHADDPRHDIP